MMTDFEQGRDQALANVDAILLKEQRRVACEHGWPPNATPSVPHPASRASCEWWLLEMLRRRIKSLAPQCGHSRDEGYPNGECDFWGCPSRWAPSIAPVGEYVQLPLDPDVKDSL